MSNNNDLLYTNRFYSKKDLTKKQIKSSVANTPAYLQNLDKRTNSTRKYMRTNILTNDALPVDKTLNNQFPANRNKNSYPILSDAFQDMSEDKYHKIKKTSLSINSDDRRYSHSILPNNYILQLHNKFTNIQKIVLKDISISNTLQTINGNNNSLYWQYPTKKLLRDTGSDNQLIPTKSNNIYFSKVFPDEVSTASEEQMIYGYKFPPAFPKVIDLPSYIKRYLNSYVIHGKKGLYDYDNIELQDTSKNTEDNEVPYSNLTRKYIESPYGNTDNLNRNMLFNVDIDINLHIVNIVNRIEEVQILAIQTIYSSNGGNVSTADDFTFGDTSGAFMRDPPVSFMKPNKLYVTILLESNIGFDDTSPVGPYPLVITGLDNIGGIDSVYLNNTCFFDERIYTNNGFSSAPEYVSTFKKFDIITVNGNVRLRRLELTLSTGNSGLRFDSSGFMVTTSKSDTVIFNKSLQKVLDGGTGSGIYYTLEENIQVTTDEYPLIGRALPFRFYNGGAVSNDGESCINTYSNILDLLSFKNHDVSDYIQTMSLNQNFKFIHKNTDQILTSAFSSTDQKNIVQEMFRINFPQYRLNIENYNGEYYFRSHPFIFLKILPSLNDKSTTNSLYRVTNTKNKDILSVYQKEFYFNIDKSFTSGTIYTKNAQNLFAKIYLKPIPYKTIIDTTGRYEYLFDESPLENLDTLQIQIVDPFGEILDLYLPHSFTIDIYEKISVLKDTLIDSRHGDIVTNGIANIYSN